MGLLHILELDSLSRGLSGSGTRATTRGRCEGLYWRITIGKNGAVSKGGVNVGIAYNFVIRESPTYQLFKTDLKPWLRENQNCGHL